MLALIKGNLHFIMAHVINNNYPAKSCRIYLQNILRYPMSCKLSWITSANVMQDSLINYSRSSQQEKTKKQQIFFQQNEMQSPSALGVMNSSLKNKKTPSYYMYMYVDKFPHQIHALSQN